MHPRHGLLDSAANRLIGCAGIFRVNAALQADLGGAARPGFLGATCDFRMVKIIGRAAQGFMRLALAEGAEAATIGADIGVIDVPIDDIAHGIARNRLADRGRSPQARPNLSRAERDGSDEPSSTSADPLRQAESGQMLALLRQALFKLPERAREVYLLNRITGMSYTQIAQHCGITAKTVEKHIARALQGLRQELGPHPLHNDRDNE